MPVGSAGFFWVAIGFHGNELGRKKHAASTVFSCVDIGCHFRSAGLALVVKKVQEKTASYITGNQIDRLPVQVATSDPKAATREVGARLQAAREALNMTQAALAASYGGSKPGIQDNEAGKSMPGGRVLAALLGHGININWVLNAVGPMRLDDASQRGPGINADALAAIIYALIEAQRGQVDPAFTARSAADAYQRYVAAGVVTETGLSPNGSKVA